MADFENKKVAVFIDAEGIPSQYAERILSEASNYGDVTIKRLFADWSKTGVQSWKSKVEQYAFTTIHQYAFVSGKNTSDNSLIVSAIATLLDKKIDVFCIAANDSDFTSLVLELRERCKIMVGFGSKKEKEIKPAFVNAFTDFYFLKETPTKESAPDKNKGKLPQNQIEEFRNIIEELLGKDGKACFSTVVQMMKNKFSAFNHKNYGFSSMKRLIEFNLSDVGSYRIQTEKNGRAYIVRKENAVTN